MRAASRGFCSGPAKFGRRYWIASSSERRKLICSSASAASIHCGSNTIRACEAPNRFCTPGTNVCWMACKHASLTHQLLEACITPKSLSADQRPHQLLPSPAMPFCQAGGIGPRLLKRKELICLVALSGLSKSAEECPANKNKTDMASTLGLLPLAISAQARMRSNLLLLGNDTPECL